MTKSSWKDELQEAAPAFKKTSVPSKPKAETSVAASASSAAPVLSDIRVIVRDARKPMGEVHQMALRLPIELSQRLDRHIAGQRHAAILAILEYGLDKLIEENKVLEVK